MQQNWWLQIHIYSICTQKLKNWWRNKPLQNSTVSSASFSSLQSFWPLHSKSLNMHKPELHEYFPNCVQFFSKSVRYKYNGWNFCRTLSHILQAFPLWSTTIICLINSFRSCVHVCKFCQKTASFFENKVLWKLKLSK